MSPTRAKHRKRGFRLGCILLVVVTAPLAIASGARAAPASVAIDDLTPALEEGEGGSSKVTVGLTNLSDAEIDVSAVARKKDNCPLTPSPAQLPAAVHTAVTVAVPATCKAGDGLTVDLSTGAGTTSAAQTFAIVPEPREKHEKPNWYQLWAFAIALVALLILLFLPFYLFAWRPGAGAERRLNQPLSSLDATWKFNDNWATNATAVGALLTGLFGATTAKAFLGEKAESLVALATVGAAIALIFVAAAPVVAAATKSYRAKNGKRGDAFTVGGVLTAAAIILAGAVGQLWVVAYTATRLDVGNACLFWIPCGVAIALLTLYAWRSLKDVLERGTAPAAEAEPEVEIEAAQVIAKAIEGLTAPDRDEAKKAIAATVDASAVAARERYRRRPRSALL